MMAAARAAVFLLALVALAACGDRAAGDAEVPVVDPAYLAAEDAWRRQRREDLLRPDGWTSLVGLHWLELPAHYVGSSAGSGIRIAHGPPRLALLQQTPDGFHLTPEPGVSLAIGDAAVTGRTRIRSDRDAAPDVVTFDEGRGRLALIERGSRRALRVWHHDAEARTAFTALEYWPADPAWRITARFVPHPPGRSVEIADITGNLLPTPNPGRVEFERDGRPFALEALAGSDGGLFLVFADRTSGHGSYGAGRYIDTAPPAGGTVIVDFNRAYNPPCAFTPFATCPLPPLGNRLDLAVTAGEKAYSNPVY
jgi:uncharacterized protein